MLVAFCSLLISLAPQASANATLRVRGEAQFDAVRVRQGVRGYEITGVLHDDMHQAIAGAELSLEFNPTAEGCDGSAPITNEAGLFCLVTPEFTPKAELVFAGNAYFDPSRRSLGGALDTPSPKLTLHTPTEWPLSLSSHQVVASVADVAATSRPVLRLVLDVHSTLVTLVESEALDPSGAVSITIPGGILPAAGSATLRATLLSEAGAELDTQELPVTLVSMVVVEPDEVPTTLRSDDAFTASFIVAGDEGPVSTGWLELLVDGRSLGLSPVREGRATITSKLHSPRQRIVELKAQYVPEYPWFKPARAVALSVTLLGPLPWAHVPWALLALGAALWVVRTWRRPARLALAKAPSAGIDVGVTVTGRSQRSNAWEGTVQDAHTLQAVAHARVVLWIPSLADSGILAETTTDARGRFILDLSPSASDGTAPGASTPAAPNVPEGAKLVVEAEHYSVLKQSLPPPCRMEVGIVLRRRSLLSLFQDWAKRHSVAQGETTPQAVAQEARHREQRDVERWAREMESAVFGPDPPSPDREADLSARVPAVEQSRSRSR